MQTLLVEQAHSARRQPASPGRRRILLAVHSAKLGGAERMALLEAQYLKTRFDLLISVPEGPLRSSFSEHGELTAAAATLPLWGASPTRWLRSSARTLLDALAMARLIRRRRVELVLTNSSVCVAAALAARLARVPVVVHARDVPKSRLAPLVMRTQAKLASTVVVISDGLRPYFRGTRRTRVVRIADGVNIRTRPVDGSGQCEFNSPLRLCLIGAIDPRKGQDIALTALAKLGELGIAATLQLVGRALDEQFVAAVRQQADRLQPPAAVEFIGEVQDAGPYLERADIVLAPSRGEWTPLVLMEALAQGKPAIAANVGSVAEVIDDRVSGLLVAPDSPAELADAIVEMLDDPAAAVAMAQRGRARIAADFSVERTLEGLQDELNRLLVDRPVGLTRESGPLQPVH
ncbi:MAG TPA: glycosyltransferase [Solirubrobacteraceae bacterium]|nr:glycosyltransferase [Solirubrobacteraceae bacterium]